MTSNINEESKVTGEQVNNSAAGVNFSYNDNNQFRGRGMPISVYLKNYKYKSYNQD